MGKKKGNVGCPKKNGEISELLLIMLQGVDKRIVRHMFDNLEKGIFSVEQYEKVHRRYKVADINIIHRVHNLMKGLLEDGETQITSLPEGEMGGGEVASFSGGSGAIEDLDKNRRIPL